MLKIILLSILQSGLIAFGQVFLKFSLGAVETLTFQWSCLKQVFINWNFLVCAALFGSAAALWIYMMKVFDFSIIYPLTSIAYIFAIFASLWIFQESIPTIRWIGVMVIVLGVVLISR